MPRAPRQGERRRLYGARSRMYPVTVGVIDIWAKDAYTRGQCHALAIALEERTGWPIVVLGQPACEQSRAGRALDCAPYTADLCACQPAHMGVRMPDGRFLDINGPQSLASIEKPGRRVVLGAGTPALLDAIRRDPARWPPAMMDVARVFAATLLGDLA